jgi:CheY-like chemotaxis protein
MIIEDEAIIAMDIESIIRGMGHSVTGIARTRDGAVALAKRERPDLILADIQLADNSSGIDAVNQILRDLPDMPVIFVTAFPERLLTGERPEPAFLITKPFSEEQIRSAVSQAMFFASTETLAS